MGIELQVKCTYRDSLSSRDYLQSRSSKKKEKEEKKKEKINQQLVSSSPLTFIALIRCTMLRPGQAETASQ